MLIVLDLLVGITQTLVIWLCIAANRGFLILVFWRWPETYFSYCS